MTKIPLTLAVADLYQYEAQVLTPSLKCIYILAVKYFFTKLWKIGHIKTQKISAFVSLGQLLLLNAKAYEGYRNLLI